jgi:hypothetical protein
MVGSILNRLVAAVSDILTNSSCVLPLYTTSPVDSTTNLTLALFPLPVNNMADAVNIGPTVVGPPPPPPFKAYEAVMAYEAVRLLTAPGAVITYPVRS